MARVLITGISGGLAQRVAERLQVRGDEVIGVDYRATGDLPLTLSRLVVYRANYNKTAIEDIFRKHVPERVLHLGRVGNLKESSGKRFDLNVIGSQKIMNLCAQHGVKRLVVLSTFHIYGAHAANHIPIAEDEPVRAGMDFPQLDNMAGTWVYQHPATSVCVLRPTNVIGPHLHNTMSELLRQPRIPRLLGYDPMTQLIHEDDLSDAILRAAQTDVRGVFNVAGQTAVPWATVIALAGARPIHVPSTLAHLAARFVTTAPSYLLDFLKYPCVVTDVRLREALDWKPDVPIREAIETTVAAARARRMDRE